MSVCLTIRQRADLLWADHKPHSTAAFDACLARIEALASPSYQRTISAQLKAAQDADPDFQAWKAERGWA